MGGTDDMASRAAEEEARANQNRGNPLNRVGPGTVRQDWSEAGLEAAQIRTANARAKSDQGPGLLSIQVSPPPKGSRLSAGTDGAVHAAAGSAATRRSLLAEEKRFGSGPLTSPADTHAGTRGGRLGARRGLLNPDDQVARLAKAPAPARLSPHPTLLDVRPPAAPARTKAKSVDDPTRTLTDQVENVRAMQTPKTDSLQVNALDLKANDVTSVEFRQRIHMLESQERNYREFNKHGPAFGRYQMTPPALQDVGLMDSGGAWTGKHGIYDKNNFFDSPEVQEKVFSEYIEKQDSYLSHHGVDDFIGTQIQGIKAGIKVTKSGVRAAAHRAGARMVREYFRHQEEHDWVSDASSFPEHRRKQFLQVETRLRQFQDLGK